ncbi:hypothetical protein J6590_013548 [Homalodisca vitripennis]|nr:hypothetical protein J6590_013548 [Homalodisca vitripennis]
MFLEGIKVNKLCVLDKQVQPAYAEQFPYSVSRVNQYTGCPVSGSLNDERRSITGREILNGLLDAREGNRGWQGGGVMEGEAQTELVNPPSTQHFQ